MSAARLSALQYLWRHNRPALIGFGLALMIAGFFAVRLTVFTIYWSDPAHRDQVIEGWMTPRYIARSYDMEPDLLRAALPVSADDALRPGATLSQIAADADMTLGELVAQIDAAITQARLE